MRRVALLALLALALPISAMATSIGTTDYGNSGFLGSSASITGSASTGLTFSSGLDVIVTSSGKTTGNLGTVVVTVPGVGGCTTLCAFTGGTITVTNLSNQILFQGTFNGSLTSIGGGAYSVAYALGGSPVLGGFQVSVGGLVSGDTIVTPEPGTLGLLGTGLVGLAGIVRRKIRS